MKFNKVILKKWLLILLLIGGNTWAADNAFGLASSHAWPVLEEYIDESSILDPISGLCRFIKKHPIVASGIAGAAVSGTVMYAYNHYKNEREQLLQRLQKCEAALTKACQDQDAERKSMEERMREKDQRLVAEQQNNARAESINKEREIIALRERFDSIQKLQRINLKRIEELNDANRIMAEELEHLKAGREDEGSQDEAGVWRSRHKRAKKASKKMRWTMQQRIEGLQSQLALTPAERSRVVASVKLTRKALSSLNKKSLPEEAKCNDNDSEEDGRL